MAVATPRIQHPARIVGLAVFVVATVVLLLFMVGRTGVTIPGLTQSYPYTFKVTLPDAENLATVAQVQIAGAQIGDIKSSTLEPSGTQVKAAIRSEAAPLHQGVHVQVDQRTLVGEPILAIHDGTGPAIRSGSTLPASAVIAPVTIGDVLRSLPPSTLSSLGSTIRTLGAGTSGTRQQTAQLLDALGGLGTQGNTALNALAGQSDDIKALAGEANTVLAALDTGQGQIQQTVSDADRLTAATAGQGRALASTVQSLPGVLSSASTASGSLTHLAASLSPVAQGLQAAAPNLNQALFQLPGITTQLRQLLPVLDTTLGEAPGTLTRVPVTGTNADNLIPQVQDALQNVNPMLNFLEPYGRNTAALVSNLGGAIDHPAADGKDVLAILPVITPENTLALQPNPILPLLLAPTFNPHNPYPLPGSLTDNVPFTGTYPRVQKEPK